MASKRARKRARQAANRARGGAAQTKRQRSGGRSGGRTAREIVTKATAARFTRQRLREVGPGGGIRAVGKGLAGSRIVRKALTVVRQRISRVPGVGRAFGTTRRARAGGQVPLVFGTRTKALAPRSTAAIAVRAAAPVAVGAGAAGLAFEAGRTIFDAIPGGVDLARRIRGRIPSRRGGRAQGVPFTPGGIVPTDSITHTWVANGVPFAQLADGRVMVRRKNGTIKTFRRPRPIVLGRNPGVKDLVRADKKIDSLLKMVKKRFPARRTAAPRHSQQHN